MGPKSVCHQAGECADRRRPLIWTCEQVAAVADGAPLTALPGGAMRSFAKNRGSPGAEKLARGSRGRIPSRGLAGARKFKFRRTIGPRAPPDWRGYAPRHRLAGKSRNVLEP
jgi:hypothetical protein